MSVFLCCAAGVAQTQTPAHPPSNDLKLQFNAQSHVLTVTARQTGETAIKTIEVSLNGVALITQKFPSPVKNTAAKTATSAYTMPPAVIAAQATIDKQWDTQRPMVQTKLDAFPLPLSSEQKTAIMASFQPKDLSAATVAAFSRLLARHPDLDVTFDGLNALRDTAFKTLNPLMPQAQVQAALNKNKAPQPVVTMTPEQKNALATFADISSIPQAVTSYIMSSDYKMVNTFLAGVTTYSMIATNANAQVVQYVITDAKPGATLTVKATCSTGGALLKSLKL
jgi:hypothetical protein